jgi:hypothetical protein
MSVPSNVNVIELNAERVRRNARATTEGASLTLRERCLQSPALGRAALTAELVRFPGQDAVTTVR